LVACSVVENSRADVRAGMKLKKGSSITMDPQEISEMVRICVAQACVPCLPQPSFYPSPSLPRVAGLIPGSTNSVCCGSIGLPPVSTPLQLLPLGAMMSTQCTTYDRVHAPPPPPPSSCHCTFTKRVADTHLQSPYHCTHSTSRNSINEKLGKCKLQHWSTPILKYLLLLPLGDLLKCRLARMRCCELCNPC
jgi:hypothetical protein